MSKWSLSEAVCLPLAPQLVRRARLETERKRRKEGGERPLSVPSQVANPPASLPLTVKPPVFPELPRIETDRRQSLAPQDGQAFRAAGGRQGNRDSSPSVTVARPVGALLRSSTHSRGSGGGVGGAGRPHFRTHRHTRRRRLGDRAEPGFPPETERLGGHRSAGHCITARTRAPEVPRGLGQPSHLSPRALPTARESPHSCPPSLLPEHFQTHGYNLCEEFLTV